MLVFALPARMAFVRIQPPAQHEMRAVLVTVFLSLHGFADHFGQVAVRLIAALVGGIGVFGVRLHARE